MLPWSIMPGFEGVESIHPCQAAKSEHAMCGACPRAHVADGWADGGAVSFFSSNLRLAHLEGLADIGARRGRVLRRRGRRLLGPSRVVGLMPSARKQVLDARVLVTEATGTGKGTCLVSSKSRCMAYRHTEWRQGRARGKSSGDGRSTAGYACRREKASCVDSPAGQRARQCTRCAAHGVTEGRQQRVRHRESVATR